MITIGVSIAVPEPHGEWLRAQRRSFGDANADHIPSHITLAPPLDVRREELARVTEALTAEARRHTPFVIALGGTGTFRPVSEVVYVVVRQGVPESAELARGVTRALKAPEPMHEFHPHVTVAHDISAEQLDHAATELADFEAEFMVSAFSLYVHDITRGWTPLKDFPLGSSLGPGAQVTQ